MSGTEQRDEARRRFLLRRFWSTAIGFWRGNAKRSAWFLTIFLFVLVVVQLFFSYQINVWNREFFDALQQRDGPKALWQAGIFVPLAVGSVLLGVIAVWGRMTTQRRWRRWMTGHVADRWLNNGRYYHLELIKGDHTNPEYRLAEDLRISTDPPVDFAVGIFSAIISAVTFIGVLWVVGGNLEINLGGTDLVIPGFLVIAAVIYAGIATGAMVLIGRSFVRVSESKNQAEAEYRYVLTRLRENGESIALLGGEEEERAGVDRSLKNVMRRWRDLMGQHMRTTIVSQGSGLIAPVVPIVLCAPKFLAGTMSLGEVMQAQSAFITVQVAFNWLVENYPRLADWTASARRLASLLVSLDSLEKAEEEGGIGRIARGETTDAALRLCDVSVTLDNGTAVVSDADVAIMPGERVLIMGESGSGKSTLLRAVAGLWPWGGGEVKIKPGANMFLMPQRPYLPLGSLRRAVSYPAAADTFDDQIVRAELETVGLGEHVDRLDAEASWDQTLSGGERQRLAFARLLLHKPDIVIMDEATSALDPGSQEFLLNLIRERLPELTIISVGHRPELEAFHDRKLVLEHRTGGAQLVRDEILDTAPRRYAGGVRRWLRRRRREDADPMAPKPARGAVETATTTNPAPKPNAAEDKRVSLDV